MEMNPCVGDIVLALNSLEDWMASKQLPKDLLNRMNDIHLRPEPYGLTPDHRSVELPHRPDHTPAYWGHSGWYVCVCVCVCVYVCVCVCVCVCVLCVCVCVKLFFFCIIIK